MGKDAVVVARTAKTYIFAVQLAKSRGDGEHSRKNASQGELRSHWFF